MRLGLNCTAIGRSQTSHWMALELVEYIEHPLCYSCNLLEVVCLTKSSMTGWRVEK